MFLGFVYVIAPLSGAMEMVEDREVCVCVLVGTRPLFESHITQEICLQIRARNQLRVNGFSFGLYYASFFTVNGIMMLAMYGALLGIVQVTISI